MNNLNISRHSFTDVFWKIVFSNGSQIIDHAKADIVGRHMQFENLRKSAEYNTGSITVAAAVGLTMLTHYFRPRVVAEVGTFIGRSTYSLALGHQLNGVPAPHIHTCDFSSDIKLDFAASFPGIVQYPKKSSTEMLAALLSNKIVPDMYLLDGRIQEHDLHLLQQLNAGDAIFLLDDFEGTEKGVSNAFSLTSIFKDNFLLAYPPSQSFLQSFGLTDTSTTAVLIPGKRIRFVNQG